MTRSDPSKDKSEWMTAMIYGDNVFGVAGVVSGGKIPVSFALRFGS